MVNANPDLENAQAKIKTLFELINITNVVLVDDDYGINLDTVINLAVQVDDISKIEIGRISTLLEEISPLEDATIFRQVLEQLFEDGTTSLEEIYELFKSHATQSTNSIELLFENFDFQPLSPTEWKEGSDKFLDDKIRKHTLFLFDMRLAKTDETGGLRIISNLLGKYTDIICGLISNTFKPDEEHAKWIEYTNETSTFPNLNRNHFALMSKAHERYSARLNSLRRIVLNRRAHQFLDTAIDHVKKANDEAINEIRSLDIYDLEIMIFRSSYKEGVWEFDTLSRILSILQRNKLITHSKQSDELNKLANEMREITSISKPDGDITKSAQNIRYSELYDENEIINQYHLPLELGDIFCIQYENIQSHYILLTQSCDLMVREKNPAGKRAVKEGVLVEITGNGSPKSLVYELEKFSEQRVYANFKKSHNVNLSILDLVVLNNDGIAKFTKENPPEKPSLTMPWKLRYKLLAEYFDKEINKFNKLKSELSEVSENINFVPSLLLPNFSRTLDVETKVSEDSISFSIQRVKRLRQPWADSILTKYALSTARDAFEHDFTDAQ